MKIITVVGARPQFIKAAPLSQELGQYQILVHTGQHYDQNMSDVFFEELGIPAPKYNLNIGGGRHGEQTGRMLADLESVMLEEQPRCVLIYGDTNSTLAGALAASKLHIPVAHVEAGLRSFDRRMPEEVNRIVADHLSEILFAPTLTAVANLEREGLADRAIHCVGDVMYDAALHFADKADKESEILGRLSLGPKDYILATVHRAENTDSSGRLGAIFEALQQLGQSQNIVMPLHPRTRNALTNAGMLERLSRIRLIEPVSYLDMIQLEKSAKLLVTDSGGVQKEAFFFRVPCVTLRENTEWVELLEGGWNRLAPPFVREEIIQQIEDALADEPVPVDSPYGDGNASQRIAEILID
ncbi:MAG: UDP-N-acetylglucosamine 2-epimerase (non-hydrolyzing) [Planctomycetota bacterium]|nr:UDP-N-acetylglucosamine 2-epimerase (non-hydrolyzing) [Planctomycetota bacterium]